MRQRWDRLVFSLSFWPKVQMKTLVEQIFPLICATPISEKGIIIIWVGERIEKGLCVYVRISGVITQMLIIVCVCNCKGGVLGAVGHNSAVFFLLYLFGVVKRWKPKLLWLYRSPPLSQCPSICSRRRQKSIRRRSYSQSLLGSVYFYSDLANGSFDSARKPHNMQMESAVLKAPVSPFITSSGEWDIQSTHKASVDIIYKILDLFCSCNIVKSSEKEFVNFIIWRGISGFLYTKKAWTNPRE